MVCHEQKISSMTEPSDVLSIADVARRLDISRSIARRLFSDHGGPLHRLGGDFTKRVLTSRVAFDAWVVGTESATSDRRSA